MKFSINEKFYTVSGEAPCPGFPVYLIRFCGCNLLCAYCDTNYHNDELFSMDEDELITDIRNAVETYPGVRVLLTGGEPLLGDRYRGLMSIIEKLPYIAFYVETNGTVEITGSLPDNVHIVADWKTESSGHSNSFSPSNFSMLREGVDCIKIVASKSDLGSVIEVIHAIKERKSGLDIYISPQWGSLTFEELADFIVKNRLPAALSLQLHKIIWGEKRGV